MSALLLALTTQSLAATLTVGPSGDYATLGDALDDANDGDVIELEAGTFDGGVSLSALDVTIRGAGAGSTTIVGGSPVITATSGDLTVEDLTIDGDGDQGVKVGYGELHLTDVTVEDVGGAQNGGGVYAVENPVTITRVSFSRGDVGVYNGAFLYLYTSDAEITESSFEDGLAERGGAVFVYASDLTLSTSSFYDNTATLGDGTTRGGAIRGEEANVTLVDVTFEGNTCEGGYGGAVSMFGGVLEVTGSSFSTPMK
jgi:predicted outer membrane repeat protein